MSSLAQALHGALDRLVQAHHVHASFPIDRLFNKLAFMTVIVQAVGIIMASFAAETKVSCTLDSEGNDTDKFDRRSYAENYCYSRGVDQSNVEGNSVPASLSGVLHHYMLQVYLPGIMLLQAVMLYLPYYVWSKTWGECLREHIQFVVDLSKKLLKDAPADEHHHHHHSQSCRHERMQQGRQSKNDVLTESGLKRRLRRWYCKGKHTLHYYVFQSARVILLSGWIGFYNFCPGFRHSDIRYQFLCKIEHNGWYRYWCVLLQASVYEIGWCTNMSILTFCLALCLRQMIYKFPFQMSCRCLNCKTKRCQQKCRKECKSHYFQRILGVVVEPKRPPGRRRRAVAMGDSCCCCFESEYEEMPGATDFWSPRLADRYYISHLCYENAHLLSDVLPDMSSANASDEFSSFGNLASIAMKLDNKSDQLVDDVDEKLRAAESNAKSSLLTKFGSLASTVKEEAVESASASSLSRETLDKLKS